VRSVELVLQRYLWRGRGERWREAGKVKEAEPALSTQASREGEGGELEFELNLLGLRSLHSLDG